MADITDLEETRFRRELEAIVKGKKKIKPFKTDLDLCGASVHFAGDVLAGASASKDRLSIVVYDDAGTARAIGAFRIEREQWQKFKEYGDRLLDAHADFASRQPKAD